MENKKQNKLQFPLGIYVDDDQRENRLKGTTFKKLFGNQENKKEDLGIKWY